MPVITMEELDAIAPELRFRPETKRHVHFALNLIGKKTGMDPIAVMSSRYKHLEFLRSAGVASTSIQNQTARAQRTRPGQTERI
jgi:hypothetical protein